MTFKNVDSDLVTKVHVNAAPGAHGWLRSHIHVYLLPQQFIISEEVQISPRIISVVFSNSNTALEMNIISFDICCQNKRKEIKKVVWKAEAGDLAIKSSMGLCLRNRDSEKSPKSSPKGFASDAALAGFPHFQVGELHFIKG